MGGLARTASAWLALSFTLLLCGVLASGSSAAEPLPVSSTSPANGATIPLPTGPVPFEVVVPVTHPYSMSVEVSTQNIPGQDGSLADDYRKDFFSLFKSDAYPTIYRGQSEYVAGGNWWSSTPGTYYWQVHAYYSDGEAPYFHDYLSPVYTLVIAPAAAPPSVAESPPGTIAPLTLSESYAAVKEIIRNETGKPAHHLSNKCRKTSTYRAICQADWTSSARTTASTFLYSGTFGLIAGTTNHFLFLGLRARYGCAKRHGARRCAHKVSWQQ